MTTVTDRVLAFAHDAFLDHIEGLLDDPSFLSPMHMPYSEARAYFDEQRAIAADLGLDWDTLLNEHGTAFEIARLMKLEEDVRR